MYYITMPAFPKSADVVFNSLNRAKKVSTRDLKKQYAYTANPNPPAPGADLSGLAQTFTDDLNAMTASFIKMESFVKSLSRTPGRANANTVNQIFVETVATLAQQLLAAKSFLDSSLNNDLTQFDDEEFALISEAYARFRNKGYDTVAELNAIPARHARANAVLQDLEDNWIDEFGQFARTMDNLLSTAEGSAAVLPMAGSGFQRSEAGRHTVEFGHSIGNFPRRFL